MTSNDVPGIFTKNYKRKVAYHMLTPIKEYGVIPQKASNSSSASCAPLSYRTEMESKMESSIISIENQI
jgi:hypothetical protein